MNKKRPTHLGAILSRVIWWTVTGVSLVLDTFAGASVLAVVMILARILHLAVVTAITGFADAVVAAGKVFALAEAAVGQRVEALVDVERAVRTRVSGAATVARIVVDSVVTLAVVLARHVALNVRCTVVDVCLAVEAGEA